MIVIISLSRFFSVYLLLYYFIMLSELVNNRNTDKNTSHSYLELYESLLRKKKDSAKYVLEVGIGDFTIKNGGSIALWRDYFPNAVIVGLDILGPERVLDELKNDSRIVLYTSVDAYDKEFFTKTFLTGIQKNIRYDFLLDDGPHTLESMKTFIELYSQNMADDGILIIEDIQKIEWLDELVNVVPLHLKPFIQTYDLREKKNRYDDIVFTINRS